MIIDKYKAASSGIIAQKTKEVDERKERGENEKNPRRTLVHIE